MNIEIIFRISESGIFYASICAIFEFVGSGEFKISASEKTPSRFIAVTQPVPVNPPPPFEFLKERITCGFDKRLN